MAKRTKKKNSGATWRNTMYAKKYYSRLQAADGTERFAAGFMIPPYVNPSYYWMKVKAIAVANVAPEDSQYYAMRGAIASVPGSQQQVETDDVSGDEFIGRYLPMTSGEVFDADDSADVDAGIPQGAPIMDVAKRQEFFRREKVLGLPNNAMFADASLVRYIDDFTTKGKINPKMMPGLEEGKFLAFGVTLDDIGGSTDWGDILWGNRADMNGLLETVWEESLPNDDTNAFMLGISTLNSDFLNWLGLGYVDGEQVGANMQFHISLTVKLDLYEPASNRYISPS